MLSRLLALPFILAAAVALYLTWEVNRYYSVYIIPPAIVLVLIYFLQPQIDWWYYNRKLPDLDPKISVWLQANMPFYAALNETEQLRFRQRTKLYTIANAFIGKGIEEDSEPPEDVKAFAAACIVQLTFGREDYRMNKFERIVIYPSAFPSPQYPRNIHNSEIYEEDGVVIFAVQPLLYGISHANHYSIGLHEYAKVFLASYPEENYPDKSSLDPEALEQISGFSKEEIEKQIGLPHIALMPIAIHHFFQFSEKFKEILPQVYQQFSEVFNLDPSNPSNPVIRRSLIEKEKKK